MRFFERLSYLFACIMWPTRDCALPVADGEPFLLVDDCIATPFISTELPKMPPNLPFGVVTIHGLVS